MKETGPEPELITEAITKAPESETITEAATSSVLAHGKGTITGRNLNLNSIDPKNLMYRFETLLKMKYLFIYLVSEQWKSFITSEVCKIADCNNENAPKICPSQCGKKGEYTKELRNSHWNIMFNINICLF